MRPVRRLAIRLDVDKDSRPTRTGRGEDKMPLHPQARAVLDQGEALGIPKLNELPPDQARAQARTMIGFVGAGPELANVENITIPTSAGEISGRRYTPEDAAGTVMWIHGGGWVICDLDTHDAMGRVPAEG